MGNEKQKMQWFTFSEKGPAKCSDGLIKEAFGFCPIKGESHENDGLNHHTRTKQCTKS